MAFPFCLVVVNLAQQPNSIIVDYCSAVWLVRRVALWGLECLPKGIYRNGAIYFWEALQIRFWLEEDMLKGRRNDNVWCSIFTQVQKCEASFSQAMSFGPISDNGGNSRPAPYSAVAPPDFVNGGAPPLPPPPAGCGGPGGCGGCGGCGKGGGPGPGGPPTGQVCQFFAKSGWCKWGEGCRHAHIAGSDAPKGGGGKGDGPKTGEVCKFFAKSGWCKYGDACRHEHIAGLSDAPPLNEPCKFFAKAGWCQYADNCRYQHLAGPDTPIGGCGPGGCGGCPGYGGCGGKGCGGPGFHAPDYGYQEYGGCGPGPAQGGPGTGGQGQSGPGADGNGWSKPAFPTEVNPPPPPATKELNAEEEEVAVVALIATPGIQKAESVGLLLSADAITAILTIPATHASELLETVSARHESLRDPSNYIVSTISKGYVPKGPQY